MKPLSLLRTRQSDGRENKPRYRLSEAYETCLRLWPKKVGRDFPGGPLSPESPTSVSQLPVELKRAAGGKSTLPALGHRFNSRLPLTFLSVRGTHVGASHLC